jgi:hypothetical protein
MVKPHITVKFIEIKASFKSEPQIEKKSSAAIQGLI